LNVLEDAFREADGRSAGSVFLFRMMDLIHTDVVRGKRVHDPRQVLVDLEENVYTGAEVRRIEKRPVVVFTYFFNLSLSRQPPCRAAHYGDAPFEAAPDI